MVSRSESLASTKRNANVKSWMGILLVLAGVLIGLVLSAAVTWGETEAVLYTNYHGDRNLDVRCPLMLAPTELGVVSAKITNLTNEEIPPTIAAEISQEGMPRATEQVISLPPAGSQILEWSVDASDVVFKYLILVNILQQRYRDNPSMHGSCGIVVFSLFGLPGIASFAMLVAASLAAMVFGAMLWMQAHRPFDEHSLSLGRAGATLLVITVLALLSLFPRWWGLTLVLDLLILMVIGIILTEFMMVSQKKS